MVQRWSTRSASGWHGFESRHRVSSAEFGFEPVLRVVFSGRAFTKSTGSAFGELVFFFAKRGHIADNFQSPFVAFQKRAKISSASLERNSTELLQGWSSLTKYLLGKSSLNWISE